MGAAAFAASLRWPVAAYELADFVGCEVRTSIFKTFDQGFGGEMGLKLIVNNKEDPVGWEPGRVRKLVVDEAEGHAAAVHGTGEEVSSGKCRCGSHRRAMAS